jgi:hypothetical protein
MRIFQNNRSIEAGSESTFDRRASSSRKYIQRPAEEVCRLAHLKHRIALSHEKQERPKLKHFCLKQRDLEAARNESNRLVCLISFLTWLRSAQIGFYFQLKRDEIILLRQRQNVENPRLV